VDSVAMAAAEALEKIASKAGAAPPDADREV
jgi:hypothetical protein